MIAALVLVIHLALFCLIQLPIPIRGKRFTETLCSDLLECNQCNSYPGCNYQNNKCILSQKLIQIEDFSNLNKTKQYFYNLNNDVQRNTNVTLNEVSSKFKETKPCEDSLCVFNITLIPNSLFELTVKRGRCGSEVIDMFFIKNNETKHIIDKDISNTQIQSANYLIIRVLTLNGNSELEISILLKLENKTSRTLWMMILYVVVMILSATISIVLCIQ